MSGGHNRRLSILGNLIKILFDRISRIHNEWIRNLSANERKIPPGDVYAARDLMNGGVRTAIVTGCEAILGFSALILAAQLVNGNESRTTSGSD